MSGRRHCHRHRCSKRDDTAARGYCDHTRIVDDISLLPVLSLLSPLLLSLSLHVVRTSLLLPLSMLHIVFRFEACCLSLSVLLQIVLSLPPSAFLYDAAS